MSENTNAASEAPPQKAAKTAAPAPAQADAKLATAVAEALRQSNAHRFGPPAAGPTARVQVVADLIRGGARCRDAMRAAGYGGKFIDGNAAQFPFFLAKNGLLTDAEAMVAAGVASLEG